MCELPHCFIIDYVQLTNGKSFSLCSDIVINTFDRYLSSTSFNIITIFYSEILSFL